RGREPGGVVLHVQPLPHQIGGEIFETWKVLEASFYERDLFTAVHPFDSEGGLRVELADRAGCHFEPRAASPESRSETCSSPWTNSPTMCWSSRVKKMLRNATRGSRLRARNDNLHGLRA